MRRWVLEDRNKGRRNNRKIKYVHKRQNRNNNAYQWPNFFLPADRANISPSSRKRLVWTNRLAKLFYLSRARSVVNPLTRTCVSEELNNALHNFTTHLEQQITAQNSCQQKKRNDNTRGTVCIKLSRHSR